MIQNCLFQYSIGHVVVLLISKNVRISNCRFLNNQGVCVHVINQNLYLNGKSVFQNNTAKNGSGIYISKFSTVIFNENSDVLFDQNSATIGGAVFLRNNSSILFDQNSVVMFNENSANNGAIYCEASSNVTFTASSKVTFNNNSGAAIYSTDKSHITFMENSIVIFSNNHQNLNSSTSTIHSHNYGHICFKGNSLTVFYNNTAGQEFLFNATEYGGAIFSYTGNISFEENSTSKFSNNIAMYGGAIKCKYNSYMHFRNNSTTIFNNNIAFKTGAGGGAILLYSSNISFEGNSFTMFSDNIASSGGAIYTDYTSMIFLEKKSTTKFSNNTALKFGGAIYSRSDSNIIFGENSFILFHNNTAHHHGGAVCTEYRSIIKISDNSTVTFNKNKATSGAIIHSSNNCEIIITGDSSVIINDFLVKWCTDACIPYTSQMNNVLIINTNGIVLCSNKKAFICVSKKCHCKKLENILVPTNASIIHINETVSLSSIISLENIENISIIGHNKLTVLCVNKSGLSLKNCNNLIVEGITWVGCGNSSRFYQQPVLSICESINVTIKNCCFQNSMGVAIVMVHVMGKVSISNCNILNTRYASGYGYCIEFKISSTNKISKKNLASLTIIDCNFTYNGAGALGGIVSISITTNYKPFHLYLINSIFYNNSGVCIKLFHLYRYSAVIHITGKVLFQNNFAKYGAGIDPGHSTILIFDRNSEVKFTNNSVERSGAAIFIHLYSKIIFDHNSRVEFNNNKATNGTIYSEYGSEVIFTATCQVTFSGNSVTQYGAAIYSSDSSSVTFTGRSIVTFNSNVVSCNSKNLKVGGNIYSGNYGQISFEEDSLTTFKNNSADFGAAIFSFYNSMISFKGNSRVIFYNNKVHYCGILTSALFSSVYFNDTAEVIYNNNTVSSILNSTNYYESLEYAGAICTFKGTNIIFSGYSNTTFMGLL